MGQKVRPTGFRTGIMVDWLSTWYASKQDFAELLVEDTKIRAFIKRKYARSGISKIRIERTREKVTVYVVAVGLRKEGDKADIYQVAQKLLKTYKAKHAQRRAPSAPDASTQT